VRDSVNAWIDPHDPAIPEDALWHCASVFLISPLLCSMILLTLLYLLRRGSRPWVIAGHVVLGLALVFAACEPCVEILRQAFTSPVNVSLSTLLPASWSPAAIASHLGAFAGLLGLLLLRLMRGA
jgi:hypothetical protein